MKARRSVSGSHMKSFIDSQSPGQSLCQFAVSHLGSCGYHLVGEFTFYPFPTLLRVIVFSDFSFSNCESMEGSTDFRICIGQPKTLKCGLYWHWVSLSHIMIGRYILGSKIYGIYEIRDAPR